MAPPVFDFDPFRFDAGPGLLLRHGQPVALGRRAGLLLGALLSQKGEVVSKSALLDAAWPGEAVEESNLSVQIGQLRTVLGRQQTWIRTIERIGYQFVPAAAPMVPAEGPVLAVLPFTEAGGTSGEAGFADGIVAELTAALWRFRALAIASSAAGARYVLTGHVSRNDAKLKTVVLLLDSQTARVLWAQRFSGTGEAFGDDTEAVCGRIASAVAQHVRHAEIDASRRDRPFGDAAHDLFLRAHFLHRTSRPEDNAEAIALFDLALAIEPDNVQFLSGACETRHHRIAMGFPALATDDVQRCFELALRGLSLAGEDADALSVFGQAIYRTGEADLGVAAMERAVEMNPHSVQVLLNAGTANMHWGELDVAEAQFRHALVLNPQDPNQRFVIGGLSRIAMIRGAFEEALGWARRGLATNPNYGATHWTLVAANVGLKRMGEAQRRLVTFRSLHPGVTINSIIAGQPSRTNRLATTLEGLQRAGLPV